MTTSRAARHDYSTPIGGLRVELRWADLWAAVSGQVEILRMSLQQINSAHRTWIDKGDHLLLLRGLLPSLTTGDGRSTPGAAEAASTLQAAGILRDYQAEAVRCALEAPWACGILHVPMGGGKTRIAAGIAATGAALGMPRWLMISPNSELARQAAREFAARPPEMAAALSAPVAQIVSTTYAEAQKGSQEWDGVIVDEVHGLAARTRCTAYAGLRAGFRIGMSGTPFDRLDGNNTFVRALCGPTVARVQMAELQESDALARGAVRSLVFDHALERLHHE